MRLFLPLLVITGIAVACGGSDKSTSTTATPAASPHAALTDRPKSVPPAAEEVLRLSDAAVNKLTYVRVESEHHTYEYQAPDRWYLTGSGDDSCIIGKQYWTRDPMYVGPTAWGLRHENDHAYRWPNYDRLTNEVPSEENHGFVQSGARNVRLIEEADYEGESVYVLAYEFYSPSIEGPYLVEQTEWIAKESFLLRQTKAVSHDRYGSPGPFFSYYSGFDESRVLDCVQAWTWDPQ